MCSLCHGVTFTLMWTTHPHQSSAVTLLTLVAIGGFVWFLFELGVAFVHSPLSRSTLTLDP